MQPLPLQNEAHKEAWLRLPFTSSAGTEACVTEMVMTPGNLSLAYLALLQ